MSRSAGEAPRSSQPGITAEPSFYALRKASILVRSTLPQCSCFMIPEIGVSIYSRMRI